MPSRLDVRLRVWCNPWHSIDHEGRPAGAFPRHGVGNLYVGARVLATTPAKLEDGHFVSASQDTVFHYSREAVEIRDTGDGYYKRAVRDGALLAADEKTALLCGTRYAPLAVALEAERALAAAKWRACFAEELPDVDPFVEPVPGRFPGDAPAEPAAARDE